MSGRPASERTGAGRQPGAGAGLADVLDLKRDEDRRRAVRTLLRHPLLTPARPDPEAFVLVRRHAEWLREWFGREAGWSLLVDSELARLRKIVATHGDGTRGAVPASGPKTPFSRRRYVLACLALAALERSETQVTLGRLVERVLALGADPALAEAGIVVTLDSREERADLAAVARLLLGLGVLSRVAGDEQAFVNRTGDALYDIDRRVLAGLSVARRGPSMVAARGLDERLAAVLGEARPDTEDLRNRAVRHRLARRLLDDPVLYYADLTEEELAYLTSQRTHLLRRLADCTGRVPECGRRASRWSTRPGRRPTSACRRRAPTGMSRCCSPSTSPPGCGTAPASRSPWPSWSAARPRWRRSTGRTGASPRPTPARSGS
jgi:uncharacterized protein (TIGR02678 family)